MAEEKPKIKRKHELSVEEFEKLDPVEKDRLFHIEKNVSIAHGKEDIEYAEAQDKIGDTSMLCRVFSKGHGTDENVRQYIEKLRNQNKGEDADSIIFEREFSLRYLNAKSYKEWLAFDNSPIEEQIKTIVDDLRAEGKTIRLNEFESVAPRMLLEIKGKQKMSGSIETNPEGNKIEPRPVTEQQSDIDGILKNFEGDKSIPENETPEQKAERERREELERLAGKSPLLNHFANSLVGMSNAHAQTLQSSSRDLQADYQANAQKMEALKAGAVPQQGGRGGILPKLSDPQKKLMKQIDEINEANKKIAEESHKLEVKQRLADASMSSLKRNMEEFDANQAFLKKAVEDFNLKNADIAKDFDEKVAQLAKSRNCSTDDIWDDLREDTKYEHKGDPNDPNYADDIKKVAEQNSDLESLKIIKKEFQNVNKVELDNIDTLKSNGLNNLKDINGNIRDLKKNGVDVSHMKGLTGNMEKSMGNITLENISSPEDKAKNKISEEFKKQMDEIMKSIQSFIQNLGNIFKR